MQSPSLVSVIKQICTEKGITYESVIETINAALAAAYKKDFGQKNQNIKVEFDPETGTMKVFDVKIVVSDELAQKFHEERERLKKLREEAALAGNEADFHDEAQDERSEPAVLEEGEEEEKRFNPRTDISLTDARDIKSDAEEGDEIIIELDLPHDFGRMAAQTAKQVIMQRLREAERNTVYDSYKGQEHTVVTAMVQRVDNGLVFLDMGRSTAIMPRDAQIFRERYRTGDRIRVYIEEVRMGSRGPEIIVSRTSPEIVRELFATEIPEIANGSIEIKSIAREAGARSKVAVFTEHENIDPIGSCVGQRGTRVQTIISELGGEKIDIIEYSDDAVKYITHALLPAKVSEVELNNDQHTATATVESDQLSLAIGKTGQNVRLAAKLTGWKINIIELRNGEKHLLEEGGEAKSEPVTEPVAQTEGEEKNNAPETEKPSEPDSASDEAEKTDKE